MACKQKTKCCQSSSRRSGPLGTISVCSLSQAAALWSSKYPDVGRITNHLSGLSRNVGAPGRQESLRWKKKGWSGSWVVKKYPEHAQLTSLKTNWTSRL